MNNREKKVREPLFHVTKRSGIPKWKTALIYAGLVLGAFVVCLIMMLISFKLSPFKAIKYMFQGAFGSKTKILKTLKDTSILLLIALAVTPAYKMKFWNIGAEGQVLIGAFACVACMFNLGGKIPNWLLIILMFISSVGAGALWAVIPAIFKAQWKTNETLFTLMMNYIALQLVLYYIKAWVTTGTGTLPRQDYGRLPLIGGSDAWLCVIVAAVMVAFLAIYLKYTKHGYEISVVGESERTAKYIGINVKKVVIRTLVLSGAICGLVGFIIAGGIDYTVSSSTVGGRGFTAILVSWLAKFNPYMMILTALLVEFLSMGSAEVMMNIQVTNSFFSQVMIGLVFMIIIAGEFFITYSVKLARSHKKEAKSDVR